MQFCKAQVACCWKSKWTGGQLSSGQQRQQQQQPCVNGAPARRLRLCTVRAAGFVNGGTRPDHPSPVPHLCAPSWRAAWACSWAWAPLQGRAGLPAECRLGTGWATAAPPPALAAGPGGWAEAGSSKDLRCTAQCCGVHASSRQGAPVARAEVEGPAARACSTHMVGRAAAAGSHGRHSPPS